MLMLIFYADLEGYIKIPTILLTILFLVFMFNPYEFLYKTTRFEIVRVICRIIVAPFR
jgi:hypothetical protein